MSSLAKVLVAITAILQFAAMLGEMFRWAKVTELLTDWPPPVVAQTQALGFNMGLYNGFLALGLAWSLWASPAMDWHLALFFAACVFAAGIVGGLTVNRLLFAQAVFPLLALIALFATR